MSIKIPKLLLFYSCKKNILGRTEEHLTDHIYTHQAMVLKTARNSLAFHFPTESNAAGKCLCSWGWGKPQKHWGGCFMAFWPTFIAAHWEQSPE